MAVLYGIKGEQKYMDDRWPVMNQAGSSKHPKCGCSSWLSHWRTYSKSSRARCVYMSCSKDAVHGAHIQQVDAKGKPKGKSYIVPLCAGHNHPSRKNPFFIDKNAEWIEEKKQPNCKTTGLTVNKNNYFHMRVGNPNAKTICSCANFTVHYARNSGSKRVRCAAMPCKQMAKVAIPMKSLDGRTDRNLWLAPLCATHAKNGTEVYVERNTIMCPPKPMNNCAPKDGN